MTKSLEFYEEMYDEWLQDACKCNLDDDECTCMDFEDWFEDYQNDLAEAYLYDEAGCA